MMLYLFSSHLNNLTLMTHIHMTFYFGEVHPLFYYNVLCYLQIIHILNFLFFCFHTSKTLHIFVEKHFDSKEKRKCVNFSNNILTFFRYINQFLIILGIIWTMNEWIKMFLISYDTYWTIGSLHSFQNISQ